jgi:hypothetical protein
LGASLGIAPNKTFAITGPADMIVRFQWFRVRIVAAAGSAARGARGQGVM